MEAFLAELGLSSYHPAFEEEELSLELLQSMSDAVLRQCLEELGMTPDEVARVPTQQQQKEKGAMTCLLSETHIATAQVNEASTQRTAFRSSPEMHSEMQASYPTSSFASLVSQLQQELFCDDLEPPPEARAWSSARVRAFFESGGLDEGSPCELCTPTQLSSPLPACSLKECSSPVGEVAVKWQGKEYCFPYDEDTKLGDLKAWLEHHTHVSATQQKLMGWLPRKGKGKVEDGEAVSALLPVAKRLMLVVRTCPTPLHPSPPHLRPAQHT